MIINAWKKRLITLVSTITLSVGIHSSASASPNYTIQVNGKNVHTPYIVQQDQVLVPAVFFKNVGIKVDWNAEDQAVLLIDESAKITLPSGENKAYYTNQSISSWKEKTLTTTTTNKPDGTYIPLRFSGEVFGMNVSYQPKTATISIKTEKEVKVNHNKNYWLYKITEAEAGGESHEGKIAVAATILNRVESPIWPNTLNGVIFQIEKINGVDYYQYSPVKDERIYNVSPTQDTIQAVNKALNGNDPTNGATVFYNPAKTDNQWVRSQTVTTTIGNHVFAK